MNEMIEKVARALCVANCDNPDEADFGFLSDSVKGYAWQGYIPQARAAIEAMREPLEWMILQADRKAEKVFGDRETNLDPHGTWQVMIDAALGGPT